jgi:hypothetical protein
MDCRRIAAERALDAARQSFVHAILRRGAVKESGEGALRKGFMKFVS